MNKKIASLSNPPAPTHLPTGAPEETALRRRLLDVLLSPAQPPRMSYEEFLAWADEDVLAEWIDGDVIVMTPASKRHQQIGLFLAETIGGFVRLHGLGEVIQPPFQMKLPQSGREPDLLFVANQHLDRLKETYLDGPADLAVEIVSPESVGRDRGEKFYEYAQGGVPEYWLIDPQTQWAEFHRLEGERYCPAFSGQEGTYRPQALPGFWLRAEWLWQEPLPHPLRVLGEIAGLAPEAVEQFLQALSG